MREVRLYQTAPISTNLILAYLGQHVLGMPAVLITKHTDMDRHEIGKILRESASAEREGYADFFDWPDKSVKEWGGSLRRS